MGIVSVRAGVVIVNLRELGGKRKWRGERTVLLKAYTVVVFSVALPPSRNSRGGNDLARLVTDSYGLSRLLSSLWYVAFTNTSARAAWSHLS